MSIKVMSYVWDNSKAKGSELLLLLAIADHSADDGYCWPTIDALAHKTRLNKRSVMRLVQSLEDLGELYVVRSNRNNRYVVVMGRSQEAIDRILELRKESAIGDKLSPDKMSRDTGVTSIGDTGVTSTGDTGVTLIINEPSCNRQEENPTDSNGKAWFVALADLCVVDLAVSTKTQRDQLGQTSKILRTKAEASPEQIAAFGAWWYENDWRGKQGQPPTPAQVRSEWGKFKASGVAEGRRVIRMGR